MIIRRNVYNMENGRIKGNFGKKIIETKDNKNGIIVASRNKVKRLFNIYKGNKTIWVLDDY